MGTARTEVFSGPGAGRVFHQHFSCSDQQGLEEMRKACFHRL